MVFWACACSLELGWRGAGESIQSQGTGCRVTPILTTWTQDMLREIMRDDIWTRRHLGSGM